LYGSPKTQNLEDAIALAQGSQPLARTAAESMPAMREHGCRTHSVSIVRLL